MAVFWGRSSRAMQGGAAMLLVVLSLGTAPAHGTVVTYGVGLQACETYLAAKQTQSADEVAFVDWLSGYVSAANSVSNRVNSVLGDSNLEGTVLWLGAFCRIHPATAVAVALDLRIVNARSTTARPTVETIIYGTGFKSCAAYLTARQQPGADEMSYVNWLTGYLSAVNAFSLATDNVLGRSDLNAAILWVDDYCARQPGLRFAGAVTARVSSGLATGQ